MRSIQKILVHNHETHQAYDQGTCLDFVYLLRSSKLQTLANPI